MYRCGWIPESEWIPGTKISVGDDDWPDSLPCPGYLIRTLPAVSEGEQAAAALKYNALPIYHPDPEATICEAAMLVLHAYGAYEQWWTRENSKG